MSPFKAITDIWSRWTHSFDEGVADIPVLGGWFRPNWAILIVHRDGSFSVPDIHGGQTILNDEQVRQFGRQKRICLRLGDGLGQQSDIVLPNAARHDPTSMIALSMSQYFPFPVNDTAFTVHGQAEPEGANQCRFRVSFCRRSLMEKTRQAVAAYGIAPKAIDALGANASAMVNADLMSGAKAGGGKSASMLLVGVSVALVAITLSIGAWSMFVLAPQVAGLQDRRLDSGTDQALLQKRAKALAPSVLEIWKAATLALPDDAYAEYLLYEKGQLRIAGKAGNAAMLVSAIESQGMFSGTSFAAASLKEEDGKESFDLVTQVQQGERP